MAITLENVGIAVEDIDAAIAFFTDLGLTVVGRDTVSGESADTAVQISPSEHGSNPSVGTKRMCTTGMPRSAPSAISGKRVVARRSISS